MRLSYNLACTAIKTAKHWKSSTTCVGRDGKLWHACIRQKQQQQKPVQLRWLSSNGPKTPPPPPAATATGQGGASAAKPPKVKAHSPHISKTSGIGTGKDAPGVFIKNRGPVSWPSLFMVAIAAASCVAYYNIERERRMETAMGRVVSSESDGWTPNPETMAKRKFVLTPWGWFPEDDGFGPSGKPAIGGPWSLVDLDGKLVTNVSFQGKWLLLYFGFARCPDICPSEMLKIGRVLDTLKETNPEIAKRLVPVFVSVDPARDSLSALKAYAKDFHPDFVFLTGAPTQVQQMAKKYRVYVSKADETEDGDYLVDHSIVVYFHDDQGELSDCFTQSMRPPDICEKIIERMTAVPVAAQTS